MSHYSPCESRHHRLTSAETPIVFNLVYRELWRLYEERSDPEAAEILFQVFYKFVTNSIGRPAYPEFGWQMLGEYLEANNVTIFREVAKSA